MLLVIAKSPVFKSETDMHHFRKVLFMHSEVLHTSNKSLAVNEKPRTKSIHDII